MVAYYLILACSRTIPITRFARTVHQLPQSTQSMANASALWLNLIPSLIHEQAHHFYLIKRKLVISMKDY